jgi:hypothetical protein
MKNWCLIGRLGMARLKKLNPTECYKTNGTRKEEKIASQKSDTVYTVHNDLHV